MKKSAIPIYWSALALLWTLILITWPTDYRYFSDPQVINTYFQWRIISLSGIGFFLIALIFSQFVRRHIYWTLYIGALIELALTGYYFGSVQSINLKTPWFYVTYILPFVTIIINFRIWRRIFATFCLPMVYAIFFIGFRTGPGYLGYEYNDASFNIFISASLISVVLGHLIYHLNRNNFLQSRQLRIQRRRIQELADHDVLTGLYTRREFENRVEEEFARADRYDQPLTVIMIDLDHFKELNDTYGHPAGDRVLETMGSIIRSETRNSDICSRYGGEEFCIALPETPLEQAKRIGERLRKSLASRTFESEKDGPFTATCSLGITELHDDDPAFEATLKRADEALYDAKARGRDCIVCIN